MGVIMKRTQILVFCRPRADINSKIAEMAQYWESVRLIDIKDATPNGWCIFRLMATGIR